jgi:2-haloacid dehalogenase
MEQAIKAIVFDLGGVLIDWDPAYLYRKIFTEEEKMRYFLENICTPDWNEEQDAGRSLQEATALLVSNHPQYEEEIKAYYGRWEEMLGEPFQETIDILQELKASGKYPLYALTNWSAETFPIAWERFGFLHWFDGILVSGAEKDRKPFATFYQLLIDRYHLTATHTLFIDDNLRNVKGAREAGLQAIHFTSPAALRSALEERHIL